MKPFSKRPRFSIGLDFGTSTSRLCYFDNTAYVQTPPRIQPLRSLVTPLPLDASGHYSWHSGEDVITKFWAHYSRIKSEMGTLKDIELTPKRRPDETIAFRPEIIAGHLMWALYTRECNARRELRGIRDVTVTVPAEWNAIRRQATVKAAQIAGFKNVHLIEEPIAAFIAMNEFRPDDRLREARHTLVFDCGGGTLDIVVINRPSPDSLPFESGRATNPGQLAGEAIDEALSALVVENAIWEEIRSYDDDRRALADIVRQQKEFLNPRDRGQQQMAEAPWPERVELPSSKIVLEKLVLTLDQMNSVTKQFATEAQAVIRAALKQANLGSSKEVGAVIMAGGSSYLRSMQELIRNEFELLDWDNGIYLHQPDELVAIGAAMYQSDLDRGHKRFRLRLPMETFLSYQEKAGDGFEWREKPLGNPKEHVLPFHSRWPHPVVPIPKGLKDISWTLEQRYSYSTDVPDVIEQITFRNDNGHADKLKVKFDFDLNACLRTWEPTLILRDGPVTTGSLRHYDWLKKDASALAREFQIDNAPQWKSSTP